MVWYPADQWRRRRKLTARERERMLGFPDDYTLIEHQGKAASDRVRGNALGNSMDVRVMRWLGKRIALAGGF